MSEPPARERAEEARARALALLDSGEFQGALLTYDEALSLARAASDERFVDWMYTCRAAAAAEAGPADTELLELKRVLLRATDPETAFRAAYTAARIYEIRRDPRRMVSYNGRAREYAFRLGNPVFLAGAESQFGNALVADSRFEEAARAYRRALSLADAAHVSAVFRAIWKDNLGYCLLSGNGLKEGLDLVHEAVDTLRAERATGYTILPLTDLCFGYLKSDRYAEARRFGEAALELLGQAPAAPSLEKNLLYLLGETAHLSGDAPGARAYFDRLAAHYPDFRNLKAYLEVFDFRNVINLRS